MDMVKDMAYSSKNLFITAYDKNTEWMLKWFLSNHKKHSDTSILTYDFDQFKAPIDGAKNWFKKPFAMIDASKKAQKVCWIDLDCHIQGPIDEIFNYTEPNKLAMVEDLPWSTRRGEKWHNSGVVAFQDRPNILDEWATAISLNQAVGDQEVLHELVKDGMRRMIHISDLPRKFNTLRLDVLDNTIPHDMRIMHWTGAKGKEVIKDLIDG